MSTATDRFIDVRIKVTEDDTELGFYAEVDTDEAKLLRKQNGQVRWILAVNPLNKYQFFTLPKEGQFWPTKKRQKDYKQERWLSGLAKDKDAEPGKYEDGDKFHYDIFVKNKETEKVFTIDPVMEIDDRV